MSKCMLKKDKGRGLRWHSGTSSMCRVDVIVHFCPFGPTGPRPWFWPEGALMVAWWDIRAEKVVSKMGHFATRSSKRARAVSFLASWCRSQIFTFKRPLRIPEGNHGSKVSGITAKKTPNIFLTLRSHSQIFFHATFLVIHLHPLALALPPTTIGGRPANPFY